MSREWRRIVSGSSRFVFFLLLHLLIVVAEARRRLATDDDVSGLLSFKKSSIQSDPKGFLSSWVATSSLPCSWSGISCSSDGRVSAVNLSGAVLIGSLHLRDLAALQGLRSIDLGNNSFAASDLSVVGTSDGGGSCLLQSVDLSFNNFTDPWPTNSFLASCARLAYVNL